MTMAQRSLLLGGDWNEPPDKPGRWSPRWIAERTGMKVYAPPRGKRGRIDFIITSAEIPDGLKRKAGGGSDHGLIWGTIHDPHSSKRLRVAIWNVERNRGQADQTEMLRFLVASGVELDIDVFLLQEVKGYRRVLAIPGYRTIQFDQPHGAWHNAILVREGLMITNARAKQMSPFGWFLKNGEEHSPTVTTLARIEGWLVVASVHEAVSVDWRGGRILGPARRVAVRIAAARGYVRLARRLSKWNRQSRTVRGIR